MAIIEKSIEDFYRSLLLSKDYPWECWNENYSFVSYDKTHYTGRSSHDDAVNFLVAVYKIKVETFKHNPVKALSTLYAFPKEEPQAIRIRNILYFQASEYGLDKDTIYTILDNNIQSDELRFPLILP